MFGPVNITGGSILQTVKLPPFSPGKPAVGKGMPPESLYPPLLIFKIPIFSPGQLTAANPLDNPFLLAMVTFGIGTVSPGNTHLQQKQYQNQCSHNYYFVFHGISPFFPLLFMALDSGENHKVYLNFLLIIFPLYFI